MASPRCGFRILLGPVLITAACAGTPRATLPSSAAAEPWNLAPGEFPTQRLYRLGYQGPDGQGRARLTLRLEGPERFQILSADPLGRALWTFHMLGPRGLLLDHRERWACALPQEVSLRGLPLGPVGLGALPSILMGRLPAPPARPLATRQGEISYRDRGGWRWTASVAASGVGSWTLWRDGEPLLWWIRQGRGGILSHRGGVQLRWQEVVAEPLEGELPALEIPGDYRWEVCHEPDLP